MMSDRAGMVNCSFLPMPAALVLLTPEIDLTESGGQLHHAGPRQRGVAAAP
jgi:hypothetical protein